MIFLQGLCLSWFRDVFNASVMRRPNGNNLLYQPLTHIMHFVYIRRAVSTACGTTSLLPFPRFSTNHLPD